jgi:hypothetical protein
LGTKLKIGGKGFIHHSNFGEYANSRRERLPQALAKPLIKAKILDLGTSPGPKHDCGFISRFVCRARFALPQSGIG